MLLATAMTMTDGIISISSSGGSGGGGSGGSSCRARQFTTSVQCLVAAALALAWEVTVACAGCMSPGHGAVRTSRSLRMALLCLYSV